MIELTRDKRRASSTPKKSLPQRTFGLGRSRASFLSRAVVMTCVVGVLCTQISIAATTKKTTMVYGETGRLDRFDPYTVHEASGHRLADLLFDSLVSSGPGGSYEPALAQSWDVRSGGTQVMITLRPGVLWHRANNASGPSYTVTSDDVVTTLRLIKHEKSEIPNKGRFSVISSVKKIDQQKVLFTFSRAVIDPLRYLMFKVVPHHVLGQKEFLTRGDSFSTNPVGSGPYRYLEHNKTGEVVLISHDEYYGKAPNIKKIILKNYADQNIMAQSLMFGALDLVTYVSPRSLDEVVGDKRLKVLPYDALSYSFIAFNNQRAFLSKPNIRKALSLAVNRQEMLDAFFYGKGKLISGPFAPTSWAYNMDVKPMGFDKAGATAIFDAAGVSDTDGDGIREFEGKPAKLEFLVPLAGESEILKRIALAYQGYLADVGIEVELKFQDWFVWKQKVLGEFDYDLTIASWSFDDAANISSLFHSSSIKPWGNNFVGFSDPKVDELLSEISSTSNFDKRRAISHTLHALIAEKSPYMFLWTLEHYAAHNKSLSSVEVEPFSFFRHVAKWDKSLEK